MKIVLVAGNDLYQTQAKIDTFVYSIRSHFEQQSGQWSHCGHLAFRGKIENYSGPQAEKKVLDEAGILSDGQVFKFA